MSYIDAFRKNFRDISNQKNSLFYERPWWLKWSIQGAGLASMAMGSAIVVGTFGLGTPIGGAMIASGAVLFTGAYSSSDDVKKRHTLFDIAQEIDSQKSEQSIQKNPITGNFFPYLRTYIPFSSARESLHEIEKLYNHTNQRSELVSPMESRNKTKKADLWAHQQAIINVTKAAMITLNHMEGIAFTGLHPRTAQELGAEGANTANIMRKFRNGEIGMKNSLILRCQN